MRLLSHSIVQIISDMCHRQPAGCKFITLPAYAPRLLLRIGADISALAARDGLRHHFIIARDALKAWPEREREQAMAKGWADARGSLTWHRNNAKTAGAELVVLCGADKITDSASLEDFTFCDEEFIYQHSPDIFTHWLAQIMDRNGLRLPPDEFHAKLLEMLQSLRLQPGGGLAQISGRLDEIGGAESWRQLLHELAADQEHFDLPHMAGYARAKCKSNFHTYAVAARSFFDYSSLIESRHREKALKAIEQAGRQLADEHKNMLRLQDDFDAICPNNVYANADEYLAGLRRYVETADDAERQKLRKCDFVFLRDNVLNAKEKKQKKPRAAAKKISGPVLDALLAALLQTLREYMQTADEEMPEGITMRLEGLKHNFANDAESGSAAPLAGDMAQLARERLQNLLAGIDDILIHHLGGEDGGAPRINSRLMPENMEFISSIKTLAYTFAVKIMAGETELFKREYVWPLPETQPDRLNTALIAAARQAMPPASGDQAMPMALPVFHLPYYSELHGADDDEDMREIMRHALRASAPADFATDLMPAAEEAKDDKLCRPLKSLARAYGAFIEHAAQTSLWQAINPLPAEVSPPWRQLKEAYAEALERAAELAAKRQTRLAALLMRAFLILPAKDMATPWMTANNEAAALVTALHPALLEQMEARTVFLCACFRHICARLLGGGSGKTIEAEWQRYLDMAKMATPLYALPEPPQNTPSCELGGGNYIHKIGNVASLPATAMATRLHTAGERIEEDRPAADLYAQGEESRLLTRILQDYHKLRPHAQDGLCLAIMRNASVQPVIAGIHAFLQALEEKGDLRGPAPCKLRLTFFSKNSDAADLRAWLAAWRENWEETRNSEAKSDRACYRHADISVAHRVIRNSEDMESLLDAEKPNVDIALLYNILASGAKRARFIHIVDMDAAIQLKFPILEKRYLASPIEAGQLERYRIGSLRQFALGLRHAALTRAMTGEADAAGLPLIIRTNDFGCWQKALAALHKAADWVVCIDPAMDEALIRQSALPEARRDIIAFGSGVGSHGEANYTISSEQMGIEELAGHVAARLASLYGDASPGNEQCLAMARHLLRSQKLAGLALLRAASLADNYIHDYLAYSLARKLLRRPDALFDAMISLDAYRHWLPREDKHPDLLWITGEEREGRLCLRLTVIECKLGARNDDFIVNGRAQLRSGFAHLQSLFQPDQSGQIDDDRPDRRYWWHQLHRVITSGFLAREGVNEREFAALLELLTEGQFSVSWQGLLLAFWSDSESAEPELTHQWRFSDGAVHEYVIGRPLQFALALNEAGADWQFDFGHENEGPAAALPELPDETIDAGAEDALAEDDMQDAADWELDYADSNGAEPEEEPKLAAMEKEASSPAEGAAKLANNARENPAAAAQNGEDAPKPHMEAAIAAETAAPAGEITAGAANAGIPESILLGYDRSGQPVRWTFKAAENRHMLIFGSSGCGKTYAIQCILAEIARAGLNTLVLDYSQSFVPREIGAPVHEYFPDDRQHFVCNKPLPINPFARQQLEYGGGQAIEEKPIHVADRITDIFSKALNLGSQQINILRKAVIESLEAGPFAALREVEAMLDKYRNDGEHIKSVVDTLQAHIHNFALNNPFTEPKAGEENWDNVFHARPPCNHVFQLVNIASLFAAGIIEFVLWDLFFYAQRTGSAGKPKTVTLDEIQNLSLKSNSPVDKILREGRKFGIGLIAATQSFAGVKNAMSVLNQAACKLYFRPADNEMADCARQLHYADSSRDAREWKELLSRLGRGECYFVGRSDDSRRRARFTRIESMEGRGFG